MNNIFKNIEEYHRTKKHKTLIVLDEMIADMLNNKNINQIVTALFIRGRKLNISLAFITQFYFVVPKDIRLNSTHYFIIKIPNKQKLQRTASNHSSDVDFKNFINLYKKCTAKLCSFLVIDAVIDLVVDLVIIFYVSERF